MYFKRLRRNFRYNRKKRQIYLFLFVLLCSLGLAYASITTSLSINGISKFNNASWDVHFANIEVKNGSVVPTTAPTISNNTTVSFAATLEEPGEYYEFNIDVVNSGTINAMIDSIEILPVLTTEQQAYFDYIVTYADGTSLAPTHKLDSGSTEKLRIAFIYKTLADTSEYPDTDQEFTISVGINYVQQTNSAIDIPHPPTLYGVLEAEAQAGTYATTYTGEHQDSFTNTGTKNIYHWYATSDAVGTQILNKNNVIFADQCWQMIRTTDTGGVKLLYNGEAENGKCLNTRGTHIGYGDRTSQTLNSSYYYGTDYTYDATNNVFTLAGTLEPKTWDATTGPTLIGKYTCKSASATGTCSTLYLIESFNSATSAYALPISKNSHYSEFGTLAYDNNTNSPAYVGYMYNDVHPVTSRHNSFYIQNNTIQVNTSYYYSNTIDWNVTNANQYTLTNPELLSSLSGNYSSLVGKYVLGISGTHNSTVYYVVAVNSDILYYKELSRGDINTSLTIGDSYTESGGVYTLVGNITNVPYQIWYNNSDLSVYKGKYVCDGDNTSCTDIKHIYPNDNPSKSTFYYFDPATTWSFSESVVYNSGTYTLSGDIKSFWDFYVPSNQEMIATHHYTCLNNGTSCTTVGYINYISSSIYFAQLTDVENIQVALENMLHKENVNIKNSTIKNGIDAWYAKYLNSYDSFIEDTIFCNNRTIKSKGAWNANGGGITTSSNYLQFQEYSVSHDLSCNQITDQFSTLNNNAKLTYKVGLVSSSEMNLLDNNKIRNSGKEFWLSSPCYFSNINFGVRFVNSSGSLSSNFGGYAYGVRPSISIMPGTVYKSGNGSMDSPYVIE